MPQRFRSYGQRETRVRSLTELLRSVKRMRPEPGGVLAGTSVRPTIHNGLPMWNVQALNEEMAAEEARELEEQEKEQEVAGEEGGIALDQIDGGLPERDDDHMSLDYEDNDPDLLDCSNEAFIDLEDSTHQNVQEGTSPQDHDSMDEHDARASLQSQYNHADENPNDNRTPSEYDVSDMVLGLWAESSNLSGSSWSALVEGLKYMARVGTLSDIVANLPLSLKTQQKRLRKYLPTPEVHCRELALDQRTISPQGPSTIKVHFLDHKELLTQLLSSKLVYEDMYFGPAIRTDQCTEPWHGEAWAESIRAASGILPNYPGLSEAIFQSDSIVYCNDNADNLIGRVSRIWQTPEKEWLLEVQSIRYLTDISAYCLFEEVVELIPVTAVLRRKRLLMPGPNDDSDFAAVEGTICKIASNKDGVITFRPAQHRWRLLAEGELLAFGRSYLQKKFVRTRPDQVILSVPEFHFCDGFALFRSLYKTCEGFYFVPANLSYAQRRKQHNWLTLCLTPYGSHFRDIIECLAHASGPLSAGCSARLTIDGKCQETFICGFLLAGLGDMVQQSKSLGVKGIASDKPCPRCLIKHDNLDNLSYDLVSHSRYDDLMEFVRYTADQASTETKREQILKEYSLMPEASPWTAMSLGLVPFRQFCVDLNHSELKGMCTRYLNCLFDGVLTGEGQRKLATAIGQVSRPPGWIRFQSPLAHRKSFSFTELGRMILIMPFPLATLGSGDIKQHAYDILLDMADAGENESEPRGFNTLLRIFVDLSDYIKLCLQLSFSRGDYERLLQSSIAIRRSFQQLAQSQSHNKEQNNEKVERLQKLPNVHVGMHLSETARRYGTLGNVSSTMGEERHKRCKRDVMHISTAHEASEQLVRKANTQQCLKLVARGLFAKEGSFVTGLFDCMKERCPRLHASSFGRDDPTPTSQAELLSPITRSTDNGRGNKQRKKKQKTPVDTTGRLPARLSNNLPLCRAISKLYADAGIAGDDLGKKDVKYGLRASFFNPVSGSMQRVSVGQAYQNERGVYMIRYIFRHVLGNVSSIFVLLDELVQKSYNELLKSPKYASNMGPRLLQPLQFLHECEPVHLVEAPDHGMPFWIFDHSTSQRNTRARPAVDNRFLEDFSIMSDRMEYYVNRWWIQFH